MGMDSWTWRYFTRELSVRFIVLMSRGGKSGNGSPGRDSGFMKPAIRIFSRPLMNVTSRVIPLKKGICNTMCFSELRVTGSKFGTACASTQQRGSGAERIQASLVCRLQCRLRSRSVIGSLFPARNTGNCWPHIRKWSMNWPDKESLAKRAAL